MILIGRGLNQGSGASGSVSEGSERGSGEEGTSWEALHCAVVRVRESKPEAAGAEEGGSLTKGKKFPVTIARGIHLFPYRTQKLSLLALMVLGWQRPGRVGRRRDPEKDVGGAEASPTPLYCGRRTAAGSGEARKRNKPGKPNKPGIYSTTEP